MKQKTKQHNTTLTHQKLYLKSKKTKQNIHTHKKICKHAHTYILLHKNVLYINGSMYTSVRDIKKNICMSFTDITHKEVYFYFIRI